MGRVRRKRETRPVNNLPTEPLQATYRFCKACQALTPAQDPTPPVCDECGAQTIWVSLTPLKNYEHRIENFRKLSLLEQDRLLRESHGMMCVYRSDCGMGFGDGWAGMIGEDDQNNTGKWGTGFNGLGFDYPHADMWEALQAVLVRYDR